MKGSPAASLSGPLDRARRRLARMIAAGCPDHALDAELRELARVEGVLPLIEWIGGPVPPQLRTQAVLQLARRARLRRLLDLLAADGVTVIVFKGAHLAYTFYPDPALRPHVDIDLLIHPRDVEAARRVLERSGHRLLPHVSGRFVMSQFHYVDGGAGAHTYDVHWQIANPTMFRDLLPFEHVRAQAVRLEPFGAHGLGPSVPHAMLIACMHRAAHHGASDRLIWLQDLRLMLQSASTRQLDEFCRLADAAGLNAVCADACARTADLFGDVAVPARLRVQAGATPEPTRAYLAAPSPLRHLWLDLRALGSWWDRAVLLREHLFPPVGYIRQTADSRAPLPWHYATRIVRGALAWMRAE